MRHRAITRRGVIYFRLAFRLSLSPPDLVRGASRDLVSSAGSTMHRSLSRVHLSRGKKKGEAYLLAGRSFLEPVGTCSTRALHPLGRPRPFLHNGEEQDGSAAREERTEKRTRERKRVPRTISHVGVGVLNKKVSLILSLRTRWKSVDIKRLAIATLFKGR